jgi:thiamine pyrophosphokinase
MRGLILLGGDSPGARLVRERAAWADTVIAADRGLSCAMEAGIALSVAVGDFDSIDRDVLEWARLAGWELRTLPAQKDQTDGQEAIDILLAAGCREICLLGGLGGRFDHQFAHLCLLMRAVHSGARAWMEDEHTRVECFGSGVARVEGRVGDTLSILPFGEGLHVERLEGLGYPIPDRDLPIDTPYGVSNVFTEECAVVHVTAGIAVVVRYGQGGL